MLDAKVDTGGAGDAGGVGVDDDVDVGGGGAALQRGGGGGRSYPPPATIHLPGASALSAALTNFQEFPGRRSVAAMTTTCRQRHLNVRGSTRLPLP